MKFTILLSTFLFLNYSYGQDWKDMMYDNSYNFYQVCEAADNYFQTHDPNVKGSGWMTYQRWRYMNESKYAPSGDRSLIDPLFAKKQHELFLKNNPNSKAIYGSGWKELGPWSIDSITGHYAAGLGRIEDIYIDKNNTNRLYLGSRSGGFWRSLNGGTSWQGTTDTLFASGVNAITARPTNTSDVLINVQNSVNNYSHGVYRSTNGGISWAETNFNPTNVGFGGLGSNFLVYEIEYHPTIPNLVFIGTNKGVYRSDNDLSTWVQLLSSSEIREIHFHPTNPNVIYAYDSKTVNTNLNRVYVSSDAGLTWILSGTAGASTNARANVSISAACPDCIFMQSSNGIWKSQNQGASFTFISNPGEGRGAFVVSDTDTNVMVLGSIDPFVTSNGGLSFQQSGWWYLGASQHGNGNLSENFNQTNVYVHADLRAAKSINGVIYLSTDGYLCKSNDNGNTWEVLSEGTAIRENYTLGISQSNHYSSMIGSQDNGTSILGEDGWVEFYGADGMEAIIHPLNPDWMVGSFQYGGRRRTFDRGLTQSGVQPTNESGSGSAVWVAPMTYQPNNPFQIYHFSGEVWVSDDFGSNWTELGTPTTLGGLIEQAAIAENNNNIIAVSRSNKIALSMDGGFTFTAIFSGLPTNTIKDIAFDPKNDSVMVVVYDSYQNNGNKVYRTSDLGQTWENITYNLGNMPLRSVVIDHSNAANIYVGAEIGVFVMETGGNSWTAYHSELSNTSVLEMEINYGSNTLRAATWGRGMWEYTLKDRLDFPAILTTEISNPPTFIEPKEDIPQFVTSTINYDGTLSSVFVKWSINAPIFNNVLAMSNISDSTWKTNSSIPNFPDGTKIYFKVFAVGSNGDTTETYKFTYNVRYNEFAGLKESVKVPFLIYPNPNTGTFAIDLGKINEKINVQILTLEGKIVWTKEFQQLQILNCSIDVAAGTYYVLVEVNGLSSVRKIMVGE